MRPLEKKPLPIYRVITTPTGQPNTYERFVRAANQAAARAHVVNATVKVELAQADDLIRAGATGLTVEDSTASETTKATLAVVEQALNAGLVREGA